MANKLYDSNGKLKEIKNKKGETVWTQEDSIRRDKISDKSRQELLDAVESKGYQDFQELVVEILTGQTVKEIKQEGE